jgi:hypothetical protein
LNGAEAHAVLASRPAQRAAAPNRLHHRTP